MARYPLILLTSSRVSVIVSWSSSQRRYSLGSSSPLHFHLGFLLCAGAGAVVVELARVLVSTGLAAVEEVAQLVVEFAMFVVICFVVRMLLVTAFHHTIEKHFNFTGVAPPLTPAYGMKCCVRAYGTGDT